MAKQLTSDEEITCALIHTLRCHRADRERVEAQAIELRGQLNVAYTKIEGLQKELDQAKEERDEEAGKYQRCLAALDDCRRQRDEIEEERDALQKRVEELENAEQERRESQRRQGSMDMLDFNFVRFGDAKYGARWAAEKLRRARACENAHGIVTDPLNKGTIIETGLAGGDSPDDASAARYVTFGDYSYLAEWAHQALSLMRRLKDAEDFRCESLSDGKLVRCEVRFHVPVDVYSDAMLFKQNWEGKVVAGKVGG